MLAGDRRAADVDLASREITVMGDKIAARTTWCEKVMATCTAASYGKISLAVMEKEEPVDAGANRVGLTQAPGIPWKPRRNRISRRSWRSSRRPSEKLEGLVADLRAIDGELEGLATERQQHRLLHDACGALDQLARDRRRRALLGRRASAAASGEAQLRARAQPRRRASRSASARSRSAARPRFEEIDRQQERTD